MAPGSVFQAAASFPCLVSWQRPPPLLPPPASLWGGPEGGTAAEVCSVNAAINSTSLWTDCGLAARGGVGRGHGVDGVRAQGTGLSQQPSPCGAQEGGGDVEGCSRQPRPPLPFLFKPLDDKMGRQSQDRDRRVPGPTASWVGRKPRPERGAEPGPEAAGPGPGYLGSPDRALASPAPPCSAPAGVGRVAAAQAALR